MNQKIKTYSIPSKTKVTGLLNPAKIVKIINNKIRMDLN